MAYFVDGIRTPFGRAFKGIHSSTRADDLLLNLLLNFKKKRTLNPDDFLVGVAYPEGSQGYNVGRSVSFAAGLNCPSAVVSRLCASSLDACVFAALKVKQNQAKQILVGGVESMSLIPRRGANFSESNEVSFRGKEIYIQMGDTAEHVAIFSKIPRIEQEAFSNRSHSLAFKAFKNGVFSEFIDSSSGLKQDELVRENLDLKKIKELKPAFWENGTVTAATSSPLTDGATLGLIQAQKEDGCLEILDASWSAIDPKIMGLGPIESTEKLLKKNALSLKDIHKVELNEAFSVQALCVQRELQIPDEKLNVFGGAIAMGHPLGASGIRLMIHLKAALKKNELGIATLCVGGGQGLSVLVQKH